MPKYYCEYCDKYLTHDSPSVRKSHNIGKVHQQAVSLYYKQFEEEWHKSQMEAKIKEMQKNGQVPMMPPPFMQPGLMVPGQFNMPNMVPGQFPFPPANLQHPMQQQGQNAQMPPVSNQQSSMNYHYQQQQHHHHHNNASPPISNQ